MRRKKDDKRVLRSGNGRNNNSKRIRRKNRRLIPKRDNRDSYPRNRRPRTKKKRDRKLVFIMIIALVAFVIGAGIGITLSFDDGGDSDLKVENVTKEMTTNLNNTTPVYFDPDVDDIDFNENKSSRLNVEYEYSNYTYKDYALEEDY
jgi:hypothetical protein